MCTSVGGSVVKELLSISKYCKLPIEDWCVDKITDWVLVSVADGS